MPIVIYGSPVLRKKSFDITRKSEIRPLAEDMIATLKKKGGIGLAAPQVGLLKNLFIIDTSPFEDEGIEKIEKACINPEILEKSEEMSYFEEGCLSIPEIFEAVKRPEKIAARYLDTSLRWQEEEIRGITARIFQHEYDHLQGVLFIDHLSKLKRKMLSRKLNSIAQKSIRH